MDNKIFILILVLIFGYFVLFKYKEKMTMCENLDFNPSSNPITTKMNKLLLDNNLSTRSINRLVNFDSRDFNEDNQLTLKQLFEKDKIPINLQNQLMIDINSLLNSYQLYDISKDYFINLDNKVSVVKHLFLKNMVINHLLCLNAPDIPLFWGILVDMITTPAGVQCNDIDFKRYLHLKDENLVEKFFNLPGEEISFNFTNLPPMEGLIVKKDVDGEDKIIVPDFYGNLRNIKLSEDEKGEFIISFSKHFLNFGPEMLNGEYKEELDIIFDKFVEKNNRSVNHSSEEDMKELMNIFQKELENLVDIIKKTKIDPKLEQKYKRFQELYPYLRHNLLLSRTKKYLDDNEASQNAYRCLSTNNKICLPNINKIFGDKNIGFVKVSGCLDRDVNKFSESSLDNVFSNQTFWKESPQEKKNEIFTKLRIMFDYHNIKVPENYGVLKIKDLGLDLESSRDLWLSKNINFKPNEIYNTINQTMSEINNIIKKSKPEDLILEIISKMNFTQRMVWNQMLQRKDFRFSANLLKYFVFALELEKKFKNKAVEMMMNFGLPSDKTFYEIMLDYKVPVKFTKFIFEKISVFIPQFYGKSLNTKVNQVFYQDNLLNKNSYYVSYMASICYNKDRILKRMEEDFGESLSLEDYDKIKQFLDKQC
jgi:hypothetical protein